MSLSSSSNGLFSMSDSTSGTKTPPLPSTSSTLASKSQPRLSNESSNANSSPPPLSSSSSSPSPPAPPTSTFTPPPPKSPPHSLPPPSPSVSLPPPESSSPPSPPSSPPPSPSPSLSTSPPLPSSTTSPFSPPSPPPSSSSPSFSTPSSSTPPKTSSSSSPPPTSSGRTSYSSTPPPGPLYATSSSSSGSGSSPPPSDPSKNSAVMPPQGSQSPSNNNQTPNNNSTTVMSDYGNADHLPNPPSNYSARSPPQSGVNPNSTEQKKIHSPSEFDASAIASSSGLTTSSPKLSPTEALTNTAPANVSSLLSLPSAGNTGAVVGVTMAGVFVFGIIFIATGFMFKRRQKNRVEDYSPHYMAPPAKSLYTQGHSLAINSFRSQGGYPVGDPESGVLNSGKTTFSYEELMQITNGFSHQNVLGEGGFGSVYKGRLQDGREVAVKQLKAGSGQGEREFKAEVEIISRIHHRHLVSLVGYCISSQQRLLIYEFVPNQTLEHHLHGKGMPVLEWTKRLKIALGAAKGLAYIHEDCHPKIIHRDIKSANILLDEAFEAQVADFGLARLANDTNTHVSTRVMGTFGYLAPEYATSGKLTDRSDVFSFGVVLLELITGRKPVDPTQPVGEESLVEWARPLLVRTLDTGEFGELVDPRLGKQYVEGEMFKMIEAAAACVRHLAPKRPRMLQVARALDFEGEVRDLSNGVKVGQSTAYDSAQYDQEILKFRRMTFGRTDSSDYELHSGEFNSREVSETQESQKSSDISSYESDSQVFNPHSLSGRQTTNTTTTIATSYG